VPLNDDADGGRRGLRPRPDPELVGVVRERWGLFGSAVDLGGSGSLNLLVDRHVVRMHRAHVTPERLSAVQHVRRALLAQGLPCSPPVRTADGSPWVAVDGHLVEVEAYVEHDAVMDSWERLDAGMALLARAHPLLRSLDVGSAGARPDFANHLEPADVLTSTHRGTDRIRAWNPTPAESDIADAADGLADLIAAAEAGLVDLVPRQLGHGDFWHDNVLFRGGRVVLVADFDFMGVRMRIDDLALTLKCAAADLRPAFDVGHLTALVAAYDAGADRPLSTAERAALPIAIARQALSSIAGWVARLDDEIAARRHAAGTRDELDAALSLMTDLVRWQAALA